MTSQTVKEMFGQLVANYSHMTGNYDLLREAEIFLSVIPAMLDEKGVLEKYYSTLADLEARYDQAVGAIDDRQGGWKLARMQLRYIRKEALTIALKEDLIVLRRDMVSLNSMNADLHDPERGEGMLPARGPPARMAAADARTTKQPITHHP